MALECVVKVARYRFREAVHTRRVAQFRVPGAIHCARGELGIPLSLRVRVSPGNQNKVKFHKKYQHTIFMAMIFACTVPSAYSCAVPRAAALLSPTSAEPSTDNEDRKTMMNDRPGKPWLKQVDDSQGDHLLLFHRPTQQQQHPRYIYIPRKSHRILQAEDTRLGPRCIAPRSVSPLSSLSAQRRLTQPPAPVIQVKKVFRYAVLGSKKPSHQGR